MTVITGAILIGAEERRGDTTFAAIDPAAGEALPGRFAEAQASDVADACALATAAFPSLRDLDPDLAPHSWRRSPARSRGLATH